MNAPLKPVRALKRPLSAIRTVMANEAAGGIVLMVAAAAALVVANSAWRRATTTPCTSISGR